MSAALFEILEMQRLIDGEVAIQLIPPGSGLLAQMLAAGKTPVEAKKPHPEPPAAPRAGQMQHGE